MKRVYQKPMLEIVSTQIESLILVQSKDDQYSIGGDGSQWPKDGGIHDDTGGGPGVSGAKKAGLGAGNVYWED